MTEIPKRVYVYGTGDFSKRIVGILNNLNIEVISFLEFDSMRLGEGVLNPDDIEIPFGHTVLIALGNPEADINEISINLQNLGFNIILPVEIAQFFYSKNFNLVNYWLNGDKENFNRAEERINKARVLFKEKKSQDLYNNILDYRINSNLASLPKIELLEDQYMPSDLPWINTMSPVSILDCGAFTGDSVKIFMNKGVKFENYFALEPDNDNYKLLQEFISKNKIKNIISIKIATWNENTILKFQKSGGNNSGAHIASDSDENFEKVLAVNLDQFIPKIKIDLIKMDIEGAEVETIIGMINKIKSDRPFLAISVYHKPEDLWEIPLLISEKTNFYNYFLRVYGQQTFDTVLYCVPKV